MKKKYYPYIICTLLLLCCSAVEARKSRTYTKEHPLVIVSDWDFNPFEFLNSEGDPTGYNIEVLDMIFNRLDIPHRFVMQEWYVATKMFEQGEADLIHALAHNYLQPQYYKTKKYVNYYNLRAARRIDTSPLFRLRDIDSASIVILKKDDYASLRLAEMGTLPFHVEYRSPRDGLTDVRTGRVKYFIWGEIPLSRKIKELQLDSIILDPIDIPAGELRIVGYDKALIDLIDDQYTRLEQEGELQAIYDKWFHPEQHHDNASPYTLLIIVGLVVVGLLVFFLSQLTIRRLRQAVHRSNDLNNMMSQALNMGDYYVMEYDISTGHVRNVYGNLLPVQGMQVDEFYSRIALDEREGFKAEVQRMERGESTHWTVKKRFNAGTPGAPDWRHLYGQAIVELVRKRPRYIVNTVKDITRELEDVKYNEELATRYMKVFDTSLYAMSFYDAKGNLIDLNQKMRELCLIGREQERFFFEKNLFDDPHLQGIFLPGTRESLHICHHLHYPSLDIDKYVELRVVPTVDENDEIVYYVVSCRDVTDERTMYLDLTAHTRQLEDTNAMISRYEDGLHYLLTESNMYVWQFDLATHIFNFSRTLGKVDFTMNHQEYIENMQPGEREEASRNLMEMMAKGIPFNAVHCFSHTPVNSTPSWYALSGLPMYDADGKLTGYNGLARNITALMDAQQRLRQETERAENSGILKSAFLANMTHEIRTPLNAIVGFSGLLQVIDTPEERKEFLRIIRNNCDMLLRLINDILEASSMGQSMTIAPERVDLSSIFDDICQTLEQRVQEAGLPFLKDNPYDSFPAYLDKGRLQQILTNFVTNAVKYTKQGHIRVGYRKEERQQKPGLYFYCEDTGAGIPHDKQTAVFERFVKLNDYVQGTGLGLSICKSIIDRVNGEIGVTSEVGQGSTFWFWVPLRQIPEE